MRFENHWRILRCDNILPRFVAVALACVPALALAQAAPPLAARTLPTREEIEPDRRLASPPQRTRLAVEGDIERSPCALADPAYAAIKVKLTAVTFNNLGPVDVADLLPTYSALLGTEQPISIVCEIRDAAATVLRRQGYLAAVQVPTQRIEDGKVRFEILFAKLTAIRVRGDAGRAEKLIASYLDHLADGQVFNRVTAERYLLLARDIPGFDVRLALKPTGTTPGDMIGEVSVRRTPLEVDASIQNYAPQETGRFGGQVRAQFYGLTGLGDRTMISAYTTADFQEQQVVQAAHDMAIGGEGLRFGGRATFAWTHPGLGDTIPDVIARTLFANLELSYPFVRSQAFSLTGAGGLDFVNQRVRFAGLPLSLDRLRVGYLRLDGEAVDLRGVGPGGTTGWHVTGSLELRRGVSVFDSSRGCGPGGVRCAVAGFVPPSLVDGNPDATVLRFTGLAEVRFTRQLTLVLQPRLQYSSSALFAFEQYSAGNYTIGRGYDPGALTGDSGAGLSTEVRLDRLNVWPKAEISAQPYAFVDAAWVWNRNSLAGVDPERLVSIGGGARLTFAERARLDLTVAVPVESAGGIRSGDVRVLLSLTTRLLPWRNR